MNKPRITKFSGALMLALGISASCFAQRYPAFQPPAKAVKNLNVTKGLKVQLFAAEPYVLDPVDLQYDEEGNAYVVEMPDYPFEVEDGKGHGQIRKLMDTNGDGRIDKSVVFADGIIEGTSILPWKGGLIITAAPQILYYTDTDGDGKADKKEVLFSGFFTTNSEAQVTSLRLGPDNWIYANNRGQAGAITFSRKPGMPPLQVSNADIRFRLDNNEFEPETGPGQFGQTIDDWGHRFFTENSIHIQQAVIPWRYTHRHAFLPVTKFSTSITDHEELMFQKSPVPWWRAERTKQRNEFNKENETGRVEYAEGHFTGAAGGNIYVGNKIPGYYGSFFVTDVAGNLVHRDLLVPNTKLPLLSAKRPADEKDREVLFGTDMWFRPVLTVTAPDGYLYVVDYYRQHVETPVSIPEDLKVGMDFMAGSDKGRIYRVMPAGATYKPVKVNLKKMTSAQLVQQLDNPNAWYITTAHRLLLERADKSAIPALQAFFNSTKDARGRMHAMYILDALGGLTQNVVKKALDDSEAGVRENALMLAERYPELLPQVASKVNDPSNRVVMQAALSLGNFSGAEVIPALAKVVAKQGDEWTRMAVLSSNAGSSTELYNALAKGGFFQGNEKWKLAFTEEISYIIAARNNKDQLSAYLNAVDDSKGSFLIAAVKGMAKGLAKSPTATEQQKTALGGIKTDSEGNAKLAVAALKKAF